MSCSAGNSNNSILDIIAKALSTTAAKTSVITSVNRSQDSPKER